MIENLVFHRRKKVLTKHFYISLAPFLLPALDLAALPVISEVMGCVSAAREGAGAWGAAVTQGRFLLPWCLPTSLGWAGGLELKSGIVTRSIVPKLPLIAVQGLALRSYSLLGCILRFLASFFNDGGCFLPSKVGQNLSEELFKHSGF